MIKSLAPKFKRNFLPLAMHFRENLGHDFSLLLFLVPRSPTQRQQTKLIKTSSVPGAQEPKSSSLWLHHNPGLIQSYHVFPIKERCQDAESSMRLPF